MHTDPISNTAAALTLTLCRSWGEDASRVVRCWGSRARYRSCDLSHPRVEARSVSSQSLTSLRKNWGMLLQNERSPMYIDCPSICNVHTGYLCIPFRTTVHIVQFPRQPSGVVVGDTAVMARCMVCVSPSRPNHFSSSCSPGAPSTAVVTGTGLSVECLETPTSQWEAGRRLQPHADGRDAPTLPSEPPHTTARWCFGYTRGILSET